MNESQRLYWVQAKAEYELFVEFRESERPHSHALHFLQMSSEKLAKGYFWRLSKPPKLSHCMLVSFLQALKTRKSGQRLLGYPAPSSFRAAIDSVIHLAAELEKLAPDLALDGPNPEYPWPSDEPEFAPVEYRFPIWKALTEEPSGKRLLQLLETAFETFPRWDA